MQCLLALLLGTLSWIGPKSSCEVTQPPELSDPLHGPITIPFKFSFPWKLKQKSNMRPFWMKGCLCSQVIYNSSSQPHLLLWGWISLNWKPEEQGSPLLNQKLREEDESLYNCMLWASTKIRGIKNISNFRGNQVKVIEATSHQNAPPEERMNHNPRNPLDLVSDFFSNIQTNLTVTLCVCLILKIGVCVIMEILVLPKILDQPPCIPVQDQSARALQAYEKKCFSGTSQHHSSVSSHHQIEPLG